MRRIEDGPLASISVAKILLITDAMIRFVKERPCIRKEKIAPELRNHSVLQFSHREVDKMPERETLERAREDAAEGKAPSTQAGEFVREEIDHIREGKHGARSAKPDYQKRAGPV